LTGGLDNLAARLDAQLDATRNEAAARSEGFGALTGGLDNLAARLDAQLDATRNQAEARREALESLIHGLEGLGARLDAQWTASRNETASRREELQAVAHGLESLGNQLGQQLALSREDSALRREGLSEVMQGLERLGARLDRYLSQWQEEAVTSRAGFGGVTGGLEALGSRLDRQLSLMTGEAESQREALTTLRTHLSEVGGGIERQLERQLSCLEQAATRHGEWIRRGEEGITLLRGVASRVEEGGEEARRFREQLLDLADRLRQGVNEMNTRLPAGAEIAGWIREASQEAETAAEGRHARLAERLRSGHGEILARVDAGTVALEAVRTEEAGIHRLLEGVSRRLESLQGGWREGWDELAARIAQVNHAMEITLRELQLKVERAATSGEEGMALLFGEMGREMERMRRQIRESSGQVALQTREWLMSSGAGGEENLRSLMQGVSQEFKSALSTLADERSQLDEDRESALMERLLTQTAEQAEGVKMAVLGELDETAKQLATHLRASGEELLRSREETTQEVVNVIAERMETAFGGVAEELAEMRKRLVAEQKAMEHSLLAWANEASRSTMEENQVLAQRLMEVQNHFDERHQGVIGVIDQLGRGLERDLEQLRDGLYHKNEESSRHVEAHLTELGQLLEGVVTSLGREQSVFIEMLGERLDSLRRRLKVK
ncbi:MAG: hypothetical protein HQM00_13335, partial [Magnetococcales bacterium]|nr:hypothetical protein [Magnetococcales bacterium]